MYISIKLQSGSKIEHSVKKTSVTIGRSKSADFVVSDEALSRFHAKVDLEDGQYFITDLGSANGVFIDGQRLNANEKTPFATYMLLTFGALDCVIQDDLEPESSPAMELNRSENSKGQPSDGVSTKIRGTPPRVKPKTERVSQKNSGLSPDLIFVGLVLAVGIAVYLIFFQSESDLEQTEVKKSSMNGPTATVKQPKKAYRARVLNQSTDAAVYLNYNSKKTCTGYFDICKELQIEDNDNEGIFKEGPELYLYIKPSKLFKRPRLERLKDQTLAEDVLAHYLVLGSSIIKLLLSHEYDQIHLIMITADNQPNIVYRYHISKFENGEVDLSGLIDGIADSIVRNQVTEVGENLLKIFPPQYLNKP